MRPADLLPRAHLDEVAGAKVEALPLDAIFACDFDRQLAQDPQLPANPLRDRSKRDT